MPIPSPLLPRCFLALLEVSPSSTPFARHLFLYPGTMRVFSISTRGERPLARGRFPFAPGLCVCTRASLCCLHAPTPPTLLFFPHPRQASFSLPTRQETWVGEGTERGWGEASKKVGERVKRPRPLGRPERSELPFLRGGGGAVSLGKGRLKLVFFLFLCLWFCALSLSPPLLTSSLKKGG